MNLVYVSNSRIPSSTANSVHVMKMCDAFANLGHSVTLLALRGEDRSDADIFEYYGVRGSFDVERFAIRRGFASSTLLAGLVGRWARSNPVPDVFFGRSLYGLSALTGLESDIVYEVHMPPLRLIHAVLERRLIQDGRFARLIAISNSLKGEFLRRYSSLREENVVVAPDGANAPNEDPAAVSLPGGSRTCRIGYAGHLYPGKGAELIVALARRMPEFDFHLVGGTEGDLDRLLKDGLPGNTFFHGHQPHSAVPGYLSAMDVVLAPYQERVAISGGKGDVARWMSPLKIFEYMASRRPIVASDLPVLREVLEDGRNCVLCPPNDLDAWQTAIERLSVDSALRDKLSSAAREDLCDHYTWTRRAERVIANLSPPPGSDMQRAP